MLQTLSIPAFQYAIIALLALFSAVVASTAIRLILHTKLVLLFADTPNHRKVHSAPIPRVGGIAMVLAMLVTTLLWHALTRLLGAEPIPKELFHAILAAVTVLGGLGLLDDSKSINVQVRHKLSVVIILALITVFIFDVHPGAISVFNLFVIPEPVGKIIAVLWIVGLINAYNLVDGLDGFAGTISTLSLLGVVAVSVLTGCSATAVLGVFAVGAVIGFMIYNAPPAKVFMGDTGSCFLGYMVALLTIRAAFLMGESGRVLAIMPLLAGLPILEVAVTILRRYFSANMRGAAAGHSLLSFSGTKQVLKYIVTADSRHLHHRYLHRGFSHLEACILAGVLTVIITAGAVCVTIAPLSYLPWIAAYLTIPVAVTLYKLGVFEQVERLIRRQPVKLNQKLRIRTDANIGADEKAKRLFYADLITQGALALPVLTLMAYLLIS
ncbi:MAG: undecaprenyl/decaprenyl-phosphate alpha-N-acetylglucosaminyl 1-phosphate transferase [Chitinispirillales bacterium]|jgi:UDP-GlcNAc:undecaprenyl-phosphate GlcNAc-1-phosphate transferase|nr:undecaprenyl/decaprenyl-phosphate alpha-N-acetylglucosaminyl 1-phosphate transferase [Chitinispirillales bacterium]